MLIKVLFTIEMSDCKDYEKCFRVTRSPNYQPFNSDLSRTSPWRGDAFPSHCTVQRGVPCGPRALWEQAAASALPVPSTTDELQESALSHFHGLRRLTHCRYRKKYRRGWEPEWATAPNHSASILLKWENSVPGKSHQIKFYSLVCTHGCMCICAQTLCWLPHFRLPVPTPFHLENKQVVWTADVLFLDTCVLAIVLGFT